MYDFCGEDTPSSELFQKLRNIINSGSQLNKPITRSNNNPSKTTCSPYLPSEDLAEANKLLEELEKRCRSHCKTVNEITKSNNIAPNPNSQIQSQEDVIPQQHSPSFADILKRKAPAILLYPKETGEGTTAVDEILSKELSNPNITIKNIKKVQNKGIVVICDKEEDISKLVTSINNTKALANRIETKTPKKRLPSLILYDVPNSTPDEQLHQALAAQLDLSVPLRLRFKLRGRDKDASHWVLEATGDVIEKANKIKKIHLNWLMHNVREFFHIKKCMKCQCFGHLSRDCIDFRPTCGNCAARHDTGRCRSSQTVCINCSHHNLYSELKYNIRHKASDTTCPCYQGEVAAYRRTRDY